MRFSFVIPVRDDAGDVRLDVDADLTRLSEQERRWVWQLIDLCVEYAKATPSPADSGQQPCR